MPNHPHMYHLIFNSVYMVFIADDADTAYHVKLIVVESNSQTLETRIVTIVPNMAQSSDVESASKFTLP